MQFLTKLCFLEGITLDDLIIELDVSNIGKEVKYWDKGYRSIDNGPLWWKVRDRFNLDEVGFQDFCWYRGMVDNESNDTIFETWDEDHFYMIGYQDSKNNSIGEFKMSEEKVEVKNEVVEDEVVETTPEQDKADLNAFLDDFVKSNSVETPAAPAVEEVKVEVKTEAPVESTPVAKTEAPAKKDVSAEFGVGKRSAEYIKGRKEFCFKKCMALVEKANIANYGLDLDAEKLYREYTTAAVDKYWPTDLKLTGDALKAADDAKFKAYKEEYTAYINSIVNAGSAITKILNTATSSSETASEAATTENK